MEKFNELVAVAERLLGPGGCPWDREQTLFTLQPYLLEETHELIEAIDEGNHAKISEELGDVLYALIFIAKLEEKESQITLLDAIQNVVDKLIRRHPHVFGEEKIDSTQDVLSNWEKIKKGEGKKHPIDGIPPSLPALARAQKVVGKMRRITKSAPVESAIASEEELGERFWNLVKEAESKGFDAESALRRTCLAREEKFKKNTGD